VAVIDPTIVQLIDGRWQFTWPVDTPPYSVWFDGEELASGLATESFIYDGGLFPDQIAPAVEVLNSGDTIQNQIYPPRFLLQWRGLQVAVAYTVEQFINAVWVEVVQVMEEGKGYYSYTTDPLSDGDIHLFRIIAFDQATNSGIPLAFTSVITRNPAPPDVGIAITAGDIVVSAA